jgi:hypothetical protein
VRIFLLSILIATALISCATQKNTRADFEKNFKSYNDLLRWHQLAEAGLFAADTIPREYYERLAAAKDVSVIDYRVMQVKYHEGEKDAEVKIEIDYYTRSSTKVRTVEDNQRWVYQDKEGKSAWRLVSLLPEFP